MNPLKKHCFLLGIEGLLMHYQHKCTGSMILVLGRKLLTKTIGTGADLGFNDQERTNKTLTIVPFDNTCEADEVSPEVEVGVVAGLRCLQP
jgi:hypothetical protein